jgi:FtsP/CotA-like multicopper oxidase with cupredoxin domain
MGRFGNLLLVNGEPELALGARRGEVVRFYLTNTANTRVFNLAIPGARMKLVGGDSGRCEKELFVDGVVIAPSERVVVDALFDRPGLLTIEHRTPRRTYALGVVDVADESAAPSLTAEFDTPRSNADLVEARARIASYLDVEPQKTLALVAEMDMDEPELTSGAAIAYVCPMHADVISDTPGRCPQCGMNLLAAERPAVTFVCPMHPEVTSAQVERCPKCWMKLVPAAPVVGGVHGAHDHADTDVHAHAQHQPEHDSEHRHHPAGIEWEDDMVEVNRMTNPTNMRWKLIDRETGAEGAAIDWRFRVGDLVKIRLVNEMDSDHPMHHPFHLHGAGRFLIMSRDGVVESNLVWKDTVLVPAGQTIDILFEVTHPGVWMAHCHIAEHHESGMMLWFHVDGHHG